MRLAVVSIACFTMLGPISIAFGQVPVHLEPSHPAVFENTALRVLNVNIEAGDTTLDHVHANDIAIVCISGCELRTRVGGGPWGDWTSRVPGQIMGVGEYAGQPIVNAHQAGRARYHVISVENLRQTDWPHNTPESNRSGTLTNETRAFRIYDVHLAAGKESGRSAAKSSIVVILISGQITVSSKDTGQSKELARPGDWSVIPAGAGDEIKAGGSPAYVIEVDVR
jgi:quercetin dioxygenase-like cupin family protein